MYVGYGTGNVARCKQWVEAARATDACTSDVVLTAKWDNNTSNGIRDCGDWTTTVSGDSVILENYVFVEWTDLMGNQAGNVRTHRTALKITLTQQRDVVVESSAVPIYLESARLIITRVVYFPGDIGAGSRRYEVGYSVVAPCPVSPYFNQVEYQLASSVDTNGVATMSGVNQTIAYTATGTGNVVFNVGESGLFEQTAAPTSCSASQRYATTSGTLFVNAGAGCWADGEYVFTFASGAANGAFTFDLTATIEDGFNLCAADSLNAGAVARMSTGGAGPWTVGDQVSFAGNITTSGLPAAEITMRQAVVTNTKSGNLHDVYVSATGAFATFGTATSFKAAFVDGSAVTAIFGGSTSTSGWPDVSTNHLTELTDQTTYPAGTPRPFAAQVQVFGGSTLISSYLEPADYGTTGSGFKLTLSFRFVSLNLIIQKANHFLEFTLI
jgi:hypothetical protein